MRRRFLLRIRSRIFSGVADALLFKAMQKSKLSYFLKIHHLFRLAW